MNWWLILVPALGVALIALAFAVRGGRVRTFYAVYQTDAPPWVRNRVFSLFPGGVALISGTATVAAAEGEQEVPLVAFMLVTCAAMIVLFVWLFRPPELMKPRWLRDEERAPTRPGARRVHLPPAIYWGLWAVNGAFFACWLAFDWSWAWLVGLGAGISQFAASAPRRKPG